MKTKFQSAFYSIVVLVFVAAVQIIRAQGTAFTYQGKLSSGGNAATGLYDFSFALYDAAASGNQQGVTLTTNAVPVTNGYFVVVLDFGGAFDGNARWLDIAVRTNGAASYSPLVPRQALTPAPYAVMASSASNLLGALPTAQLTGALPSAQLGGTYSSAVTLDNPANSFTGNGANVTNVNAVAVGGLGVTDLWHLDGNNVAAGQFLGSTNFQALELKVNNLRALRIEPTANDVLHSNLVNLVGGSPANYIASDVYGSVIAGGGAVKYDGWTYSNSVSADISFLGGGIGNSIQPGARGSFLGGGIGNSIQTNATFSFLGGGYDNSIQPHAFASFLGGGGDNSIQPSADYSFLGGGSYNSIRTNAYRSFLGGGANNSIGTDAYESFLGGGLGNSIQTDAYDSVLGGGANNSIQTNAYGSVLGGGMGNSIQTNAYGSVLGGGLGNSIQTDASRSILGGGFYNTIQTGANNSFLGGGNGNSIQTNAFLSFLGGGENNSIQVNAIRSFLGGGWVNSIQTGAEMSFLGGGQVNSIHTNADHSFLGGGLANSISGAYGVVPGGDYNVAGTNSFAAGHRAKANHTGTFVWADSTDADFASTANNQFSVRAAGGVRFETSGGGATIDGALIFTGTNVALLNNSQTFTGAKTFNNAANSFTGTGTGLTSLNASQLTSGSVSDSRLSANVARLNNAQSFTGAKTFRNPSDNGGSLRVGADATGGESKFIYFGDSDYVRIGESATDDRMELRANQFSFLDGYIRLNDNKIFFRGGNDQFHGLGWFLSNSFGGSNPDGPVLFGNGGGSLGTVGATTNLALIWNSSGNVGIGAASPGQRLYVAGNIYATGTITPNSDRNLKTDFATVDAATVLDRVVRLPIQQWRFKAEPEGVKHVGPMAQDFRAAFDLGEIPTAIATVDADGVALAAIQGLNQKIEVGSQRSDDRMQKLEAENAELKVRLEKLERLMNQNNGGTK